MLCGHCLKKRGIEIYIIRQWRDESFTKQRKKSASSQKSVTKIFLSVISNIFVCVSRKCLKKSEKLLVILSTFFLLFIVLREGISFKWWKKETSRSGYFLNLFVKISSEVLERQFFVCYHVNPLANIYGTNQCHLATAQEREQCSSWQEAFLAKSIIRYCKIPQLPYRKFRNVAKRYFSITSGYWKHTICCLCQRIGKRVNIKFVRPSFKHVSLLHTRENARS